MGCSVLGRGAEPRQFWVLLFLLLVVLLEACSALSALSAFRFSASDRASGSVFRVLRVICVPERYGVLLSLCAFRTGITYGAEAGAEAQKCASVDKGIWLEPGISHVTWVHYDATMCLPCFVCSILPVLHFLRFDLCVL